ncbi:hypothetical protein ACL07V_37615 [Streptomyces sp. MB22_4]|uniref:hypothetical protein n=1 Tax=Streptomyces sp. MB22_4 TaxID=3383120 RepID=UPI0039A3660F
MTTRKTASTITDPELDQLHERLAHAEAAVADYENRINWHTTCAGCARVLDSSIRETERAERAETARANAEAALRQVLATLYPITRAGDPTPLGYQAIHPIHPDDYQRWTAALDQAAPAAATQATEPPLLLPRDTATTLHRALGQLLGNQDADTIARIRALHREDYGSCAECTHEFGVPWPCPTIRALDGGHQ